MNPIKRLTKKIVSFRNKRKWKQFHNPKDMALSLVLEATEVMEHFQWKNTQEMEDYVKKNKVEISEELADVLHWVLLMSHDLKIDIEKALDRKLEINEKKYSVEKSKGNHTKYNKL
jgi:NTP pyrophosphatase (non-canonical NTP hydrolase)